MDTVVVSGVDAKLGRVVARTFAERDTSLVLGARDLDVGTTVAESLDAPVEVVRADPRDEYDVERLMETASKTGEHSGIDVVAPCAAVYHGPVGETPLCETSYSAFDDTIRTNTRGVFAAITEAMPHLREGARVLVPTGAIAHGAAPGHGVFAVAAAATEAVVRGFSEDRDDVALVALEVGDVAGAGEFDEDDAAGLFSWAADRPASDIDGSRVTVADWKRRSA